MSENQTLPKTFSLFSVQYTMSFSKIYNTLPEMYFAIMYIAIILLDLSNTVGAVSLRKKVGMMSPDRNSSPPVKTDYMHPKSVEEIGSRSVQRVYERKKRQTNNANGLSVNNGRIEKSSSNNPQIGYGLRSKDANYQRKISHVDYDDTGYYTESPRTPRTPRTESHQDTHSGYPLRSKAHDYQRKVSYAEYDSGGLSSSSKSRNSNNHNAAQHTIAHDQTEVTSKQKSKKYPNKWYWQQKALRENGDVEAQNAYKMRNRRKYEAKVARKQKVIDGTATEKEKNLHQSMVNSQKRSQRLQREKKKQQ